MAKTVYWVKNSTDFSLDTSWKTKTAGATVAPVSTDTIYMAEGHDVISSGLNQSAVNLAALYMSEGAANRIGDSGSSLTISCSAGTVSFRQSGGYCFFAAGSSNVANVLVAGSNGAQFYLTGGTIGTRIDISSFCRISDSVTLSSVTIEVNMGAEVYIQYKSDATDPTVTVNGGTLRMERPALTLTQNGGVVTMAVEREAVACPAYTFNGGTMIVEKGDFTLLTAKGGGTIDFSRLTAPITITDSVFGPNVNVIGHPLVTFTNSPQLIGGRASAVGMAGPVAV